MTASGDQRPLVAIVSNVLTPYRLHFHRRIAREIPEIRLATLFTHDQPDQPWDLPDLPEIGPVRFGEGHPVSHQGHPRWVRHDWRKGGRMIRWIRANRAAAVIVGGYNDLTRLRIIRWCHARGIPQFLIADSNIHADIATGFRRIVKNVYVRSIVRRMTGVLPCGTNGALYFERYGASRDRIFYCPYEPDYALIAECPEADIAAAMRRFGLDPSRRRALVCSRLQAHKRVDVAVDAFLAIAERRPDLDLVVLGGGPEADSLRARVPTALAHRVHWLGFVGDAATIAAVYRACHVLIHPSEWEPWAVVLNEALAAGLAVLATDVVGAAADLVRKGVNGWTFRCGDVQALAALLERATEPETLARLRLGSSEVLARWRATADPVDGLRRALASVGLLPVDGRSAPDHRTAAHAGQ